MERLTFDGNFCDIAQCSAMPCQLDNNCTQRQVWERLKAYEDAGLSPAACAQAAEIERTLSDAGYSNERMVELMRADAEGRIVALPCKVGDDVFCQRDGELKNWQVQYLLACKNTIMLTVGIDGLAKAVFPADQLGRAAFLTREEAEKALKEAKNNETD